MIPVLAVWSAVNRVSTGGRVIGEAERIDPMQALVGGVTIYRREDRRPD